MSVAFVQSAHNRGAGTSVSVTTSSTGSGNLIVVFFSSNSSVTSPMVTDNASNTYFNASGATGTNFQGITTQMWYAFNSNSGATSVTVSITGSGGLDVSVQEFSGVKTSSPLDVATYGGDGGGAHTTPHLGPSLTPSQTGELLVSYVDSANVTTYATVSSPWSGSSFSSSGNAYYINAPLSAQQASWAFSGGGSGGYVSTGASFFAGLSLNLMESQSTSDVRVNDPELLKTESQSSSDNRVMSLQSLKSDAQSSSDLLDLLILTPGFITFKESQFLSDLIDTAPILAAYQESVRINEWITLQLNALSTWTQQDGNSQ